MNTRRGTDGWPGDRRATGDHAERTSGADPEATRPAAPPPGRLSASRRVRVTSPQTRVALARRHRPAQRLLPPTDPGLDDAALHRTRELYARQRRLALRTVGLLGGLLLGTSGLLAALPATATWAIADLPVAWLLLLGGSYPLLLLLAVLHVRAAERLERADEAGHDPSGPRR